MFPEAWGAYHKQENIRKISSSGGVFSALAEEMLAEGGVVFGAAMVYEEDILRCVHVECQTCEELERLRGSKYTVSDLRAIFFSIKRYLECGISVLFCGTPCQVGALYAFLGGRRQKLVTVGLICHGVPVPYLLEKFLKEQEEKSGEKIVDINFRDKTHGWGNYSTKIMTATGGCTQWPFAKSEYMRLFLSDQYLRPSCYSCQFKGAAHVSDIVLGDFWGIRNYLELSEEEIKKGVSVVAVHTEIGKRCWMNAVPRLVVISVNMDYFEKSNMPYSRSVQKPVDNLYLRRLLMRRPITSVLQVLEQGTHIRKFGGKVLRRMNFLRKGREKGHNIISLPGNNHCYGCRNCENLCPVNAISMRSDDFGVIYPFVEQERCIQCGKCFQVCPRNSSGAVR